VSRRPVRLAWTFVAFGVLCAATIVLHMGVVVALDRDLAWAAAGAWVSSWLWIGVPTGCLLVLLWFPTGAVPGPRWHWVEVGLAVAGSAIWTATAFYPGEISDFPGQTNPVGWGSRAVLDGVGWVGSATLALSAVATLAAMGWRYRTGDRTVRSQLRWLLVALLLFAATIAVPVPGSLAPAGVALAVAATVLLPLTLAVALVRPEQVVLPRVLVFGVLSAVLLGGYLAAVGAARLVLGQRADGWAALLAAGLVAVLAAPLRGHIQASVDQLVYGDRGDPRGAVVRLGNRVAASPDDLLREVVRSVADALRSPYAAVLLTGEPEPAASSGRTTGPVVTVPLLVRGSPVGELRVAHRGPRETFGPRDLSLLHELAGHVAVAAHAAHLSRDLQRSRESLVLAREEERRRIRRDLHDGLGPALAGVALGIDAARRTVPRDPAAADGHLAELATEVQNAVADVRRLVYDLRPPALDELGLVPALEEHAARLSDRGGLAVTVHSPCLPALPAAVEVAAYRITTEALTNVARHSRAHRAEVRLATEGPRLRVEVTDDGVGVPEQRTASTGVGLAAMTERATELGGSCCVRRRPEGGTAVVAMLPLGSR
jgi:signal transduction histidine kinase